MMPLTPTITFHLKKNTPPASKIPTMYSMLRQSRFYYKETWGLAVGMQWPLFAYGDDKEIQVLVGANAEEIVMKNGHP